MTKRKQGSPRLPLDRIRGAASQAGLVRVSAHQRLISAAESGPVPDPARVNYKPLNGHIQTFPHAVTVAILLVLMLSGTSAQTVRADSNMDRDVLGVCADPYMLPFSNREREGFENKIADLLADKLDAELKYKFFPQRRGFIRNTLRVQKTDGSYACDLVITVPQSFELADATKPYYTTTYVLVYAKDRGLPVVDTPAEVAEAAQQLEGFKMGLSDLGTAQQLWVLKNNLMGKIVPYQGMPGDPKHNPGESMMRDIASGEIDAAIVFGPTAGFFSQQLDEGADFVLLNMRDNPDDPRMRYEISISMAVRYGEDQWKQTVERLIEENRDEIYAILKDYGVPLLPLKVAPSSDEDD